MSYTILTIPFNLKEKEGGEFLKKGFVFDDVFPELFNNEKLNNPFLHYATFSPLLIKKAAIDIFVKSNFPEFNFSKKNTCDLFKDSGFFDKKYLSSNYDHINLNVFDQLNASSKLGQNDVIDLFEIPYDSLSPKFSYFNQNNKSKITFSIEEVNLFINKCKTTIKSIGFGYVEIVLKWDSNNSRQMIENVEPFSELYRYYGEGNKNEFDVFDSENGNLCWNKQIYNDITKLLEKNKNERVPAESKEKNKQKIKNLEKIILSEKPKKIHFELLVDELLNQMLLNKGIKDVKDVYIFLQKGKSMLKPYVLHLSNINSKDELTTIDFDNSKIKSKVQRMLRVSGSENIVINNTSTFSSVSPDLFTRQFVLNEGAFVIEGINESKDLIKKYYPAFMFALNQKYLFNYLQEKINNLKPNVYNKYNSEDLKILQETMIYAEFSQIFTSISNYNEIDLFFEQLREQFKIKDLKKEFLDSINGISKITQIEEREIAQELMRSQEANRLQEKEKTEEKEKLNSSRIGLILLLLTIAQVWPNLIKIFLKEDFGDFYFKLINISFYLLLIFVGFTFYLIILPLKSEKKLNIKEVKIKLKSFVPFLNKNKEIEYKAVENK